MFVKSILEAKGSEIITVSPGESVRTVAKLFKTQRIGFALVKTGNRILVGTVSERDIVQAIAHHGDIIGLPVADVMTTNVVTCNIDDTVETVRQIMTDKYTRHVLVMDGQAMAGIVSIGDLIKHSLNECRIDTEMMRGYIAGEGYQ